MNSALLIEIELDNRKILLKLYVEQKEISAFPFFLCIRRLGNEWAI